MQDRLLAFQTYELLHTHDPLTAVALLVLFISVQLISQLVSLVFHEYGDKHAQLPFPSPCEAIGSALSIRLQFNTQEEFVLFHEYGNKHAQLPFPSPY